MDGAENATSNASTPYHQQRERVKHVVYEMADIASGKPTRAEDGLYDTADNVCGKPVIAENGMYDTADKVCGKPVRAEDGKKGVALQGEEYDEIKTSGATAAVYDDIVSGKKLTDVKMSDNTSATVYDDILTNNTSALYDDVKVAETAPLYDEVVKTSKPPSVPTATGIDEYDDIIKGPEKASSGAAAKPSNTNAFTYTGKGEQPFDNEVYNAPYPPPDSQPPVANFANNSTYVN